MTDLETIEAQAALIRKLTDQVQSLSAQLHDEKMEHKISTAHALAAAKAQAC